MKKLVLRGSLIAPLLKVSNSSWIFYPSVVDFLEKNKEIPEEENVELDLSRHQFEDFVGTIEGYLEDDSLSDKDLPSEKERKELKELLLSL